MSPTVIGLIAQSEIQGAAVQARRDALQKLKLLIEESLAALPKEDAEESEVAEPDVIVETNGKDEADVEMSG